MVIQKDILEPVYGPDDLQTFAGILKIDNLTTEQAHQLQRAAWMYEFLNGTDAMRAGRADRRKALKLISDAARKLGETLENYNAMIIDDRAHLPFSDIDPWPKRLRTGGAPRPRAPTCSR